MDKEIYQEIIIDHFKHPRFKSSLDEGLPLYEKKNPACGDQIRLQVKEQDGSLQFSHATQGCAAAVASCSIMCGYLNGRSSSDVLLRIEAFRGQMLGEGDLAQVPDSDLEIESLLFFRNVPARVTCVLLAWDCAYNALAAS
jgi:nitrogen fixation NifU-like protein